MTVENDQPIVTLKVNGRAFKCGVKTSGGKKCVGKEFRMATVIGNTVDAHYYVCTTCSSHHPHTPNTEVKLPPRNDWRTPGGTAMKPQPGGLWTTLHAEYRYNLDLAASDENTKCPVFFDGLTKETDALKNDWFGLRMLDWFVAAGHPDHDDVMLDPSFVRAHCNPPYQPVGTVETWLEKAIEQAAKGVFSTWLIPMSSSVGWFNDLVVPYAEWHTFRGRIEFEDPLAVEADEARTNPKQDNLFVIYDPQSEVVGHTAVRDAKTGTYLWRRGS